MLKPNIKIITETTSLAFERSVERSQNRGYTLLTETFQAVYKSGTGTTNFVALMRLNDEETI